MTVPSAKIILDSVSPAGVRLTTMEVVMHRFVLAEFNTHRVFSRNSASSRAIPLAKQIERVKNDPAFPIEWRLEQPGMQGGELLDVTERMHAAEGWTSVAHIVTEWALALSDSLDIHKSILNRLLEPFLWHTVIVSSTEWDGFWRQRCSPLAQPEIRVAAEAMLAAYTESKPKELDFGEWHMPYVFEHDDEEGVDWRHISAARCARVSYLTHEGIRSTKKDEELYERLIDADPPHASPLEHVATPSSERKILGNFRGWRQLRHEVLDF